MRFDIRRCAARSLLRGSSCSASVSGGQKTSQVLRARGSSITSKPYYCGTDPTASRGVDTAPAALGAATERLPKGTLAAPGPPTVTRRSWRRRASPPSTTCPTAAWSLRHRLAPGSRTSTANWGSSSLRTGNGSVAWKRRRCRSFGCHDANRRRLVRRVSLLWGWDHLEPTDRDRSSSRTRRFLDRWLGQPAASDRRIEGSDAWHHLPRLIEFTRKSGCSDAAAEARRARPGLDPRLNIPDVLSAIPGDGRSRGIINGAHRGWRASCLIVEPGRSAGGRPRLEEFVEEVLPDYR